MTTGSDGARKVGEIMIEGWGFNPPPHWPKPPSGWTPPSGWQPDPAWGPVPPGWQLWVPARPVPRRRRSRALAGLTVLTATVGLAVLLPREAGPGPADPRAGGTPRAAAPAERSMPVSADTRAAIRSAPTASPTPSAIPGTATIRRFRSCAKLNRVYPKGVGTPKAVDRVDQGRPVTDFGRSIQLYRANRGLDRDGDHIACEPG